MRRFFVALALFSSVLIEQSVFGAEMLIDPPSRAAVVDIRPDGPPIYLGVSAGTLLYLPGTARTVFVADPNIADVQLNKSNPHFIYVVAKNPGATALYTQDKAGRIMLNNAVVVAAPPEPVTIIRAGELNNGKPPPPPNFLVLPLQPAAASPR